MSGGYDHNRKGHITFCLFVCLLVAAGCKREGERDAKGFREANDVIVLPSRSIHIGLSKVNQAVYGSWNGTCLSCIDDARWYFDTAKANGYDALPCLEDAAATGDVILATIKAEAEKLRQTGGTLLITFSGHGALIPPDMPTSRAWCAYDRQILDDELTALLVNVSSNVRVIIISDSCYSGGMLGKRRKPEWISNELRPDERQTLTAIPRDIQTRLWERDAALYLSIIATAEESIKGKSVQASVTLLAGAGANGVALQSVSGGHSTFTEAIVDTFIRGKALQKLFDDAKAETERQEPLQSPMIDTVGNVPREHFALPVFPAN